MRCIVFYSAEELNEHSKSCSITRHAPDRSATMTGRDRNRYDADGSLKNKMTRVKDVGAYGMMGEFG